MRPNQQAGGRHPDRTDRGGLLVSPPTRRQWAAWRLTEPALRRTHPGHLRIGLTSSRAPDVDPDRTLAALWRIARHDAGAGALLVACLAPGTERIGREYGRSLGRDEAEAIAVVTIWDRVARFDPYPHHVAHRLLWLARRHVHRVAVLRRTQSHELAADASLHVRVDAAGVPPLVLLRQAVTAGAGTARGAWLVWATRCAGLSLGDAGQLLGLGYEAAKKCRQRTEAALAAWLTTDTDTRRTA